MGGSIGVHIRRLLICEGVYRAIGLTNLIGLLAQNLHMPGKMGNN